MLQNVVMELEKETPGTYRYKEILKTPEQTLIGTLYIKKNALKEEDGVPEKIEVTVKSL